MAQENPTWGQARVAAELSVKLGIYVSPRTVRAYWPPEPERRGNGRACSQNWRTFVRNQPSPSWTSSSRLFGLRVLRTPVRAPKANAYCERLVGSIRRECLDFMIPLGEKHLRRILAEWVMHYNQGRPHLSLGPGTPEPAAAYLPLQGHDRHSLAQDCKVVARAVLGGLHHEYQWERIAA